MARAKTDVSTPVQSVFAVEELIELSHVEVYQPVKLLDGVKQCFDVKLGHRMVYNPKTMLITVSYSKGIDPHEVMIPVSNCAWMSRS